MTTLIDQATGVDTASSFGDTIGDATDNRGRRRGSRRNGERRSDRNNSAARGHRRRNPLRRLDVRLMLGVLTVALPVMAGISGLLRR